jgi:hypothetical protein
MSCALGEVVRLLRPTRDSDERILTTATPNRNPSNENVMKSQFNSNIRTQSFPKEWNVLMKSARWNRPGKSHERIGGMQPGFIILGGFRCRMVGTHLSEMVA